jgi:hypothetical protein
MSHTAHCPDPDDARREGERDFERGRHRWGNPYEGECDEAADEWRRGYVAAERAEERREAEERDARHERELEERRERDREAEENAAQEQEFFAMQDERQIESEVRAMAENDAPETPQTPAEQTPAETTDTPQESSGSTPPTE